MTGNQIQWMLKVFQINTSYFTNMIENGGGTVVTISSMAVINPGLMGGVSILQQKQLLQLRWLQCDKN